MRSLLYFVICTVGLAYVTPALAKKVQTPNEIVLELNESVVSGQSLALNTSLSARTDFYRSSVRVVITTPEGDIVAAPMQVFSGDGKAGFNSLDEINLPPLEVGQYKVQGIFTVYLNKRGNKPIVSGDNLYLDVRKDAVLSSTISFLDIKRKDLKAQLDKRMTDLQARGSDPANDNQLKLLKASIDKLNRVDVVKQNNAKRLGAVPASIPQYRSAEQRGVQTLEVSAAVPEPADPRKRARRKAATWDTANAVPETAQDELRQ